MKLFGYKFNKKALLINGVVLVAPLLDFAAQNISAIAPVVSPAVLSIATVTILAITMVWHQFSPLVKKEVEELPDDATNE